jgi:hypothetical protein
MKWTELLEIAADQPAFASGFLKAGWDAARTDVAPFLERPEDVELIAPATVRSLLKKPG